jgi:hypothetical protein
VAPLFARHRQQGQRQQRQRDRADVARHGVRHRALADEPLVAIERLAEQLAPAIGQRPPHHQRQRRAGPDPADCPPPRPVAPRAQQVGQDMPLARRQRPQHSQQHQPDDEVARQESHDHAALPPVTAPRLRAITPATDPTAPVYRPPRRHRRLSGARRAASAECARQGVPGEGAPPPPSIEVAGAASAASPAVRPRPWGRSLHRRRGAPTTEHAVALPTPGRPLDSEAPRSLCSPARDTPPARQGCSHLSDMLT